MALIKPQLKVIEKDKLYLSRRPGFVAWFLLGVTVTLFVELCRCFVDSLFVLGVLLFGSIIFGLDVIGTWEDVLLDRNQNIAIVTKYVWSEKLFLTNLEKSTVLNLTDIRHVGASPETGLFFLSKTGRTVTFDTRGLTVNEAQAMKKRVVNFLEETRMHNAGPYTTTSFYEKCSSGSDNEEQPPYRNFCKEFTTQRPTRRSSEMIPAVAAIQKRLSSPLLGIGNEFTRTIARQKLRSHRNRGVAESRSKVLAQSQEEPKRVAPSV